MSRWRLSLLDVAGPTALVAVILMWFLIQAFGWALVYWRFLPHEFRFATGIPPWAQGRFVDAMYASLLTLTTLGFGDITPTTTWLRLLMPLEALIGFVILTAGLSWVLSVYPVLHRRRASAHRILIATGEKGGRDGTWFSNDAVLAEGIVAALVDIYDDLRSFPITFYFRACDVKSALPIALATLYRCSQVGAERNTGLERIHSALSDLCEQVGTRYLRTTSTTTMGLIAEIGHQHGWADEVQNVLSGETG